MTHLAWRKHWLYRCYDADGFLLYIGVTSDLRSRLSGHRNPPANWPHPNAQLAERMATYEAEEFPDRASAFEAEALAIRVERPPLNVKHAEGNRLTPYRKTHHGVRPIEEKPMPLEKDHTLQEAADILRVSTRTIRNRIKAGMDPHDDAPFVEHIRRGNRILFTSDQLEKLRHSDAKTAPVVVESITTGRKKRAS